MQAVVRGKGAATRGKLGVTRTWRRRRGGLWATRETSTACRVQDGEAARAVEAAAPEAAAGGDKGNGGMKNYFADEMLNKYCRERSIKRSFELLDSMLESPSSMSPAQWKRALYFAQTRRSPSAACRVINGMVAQGVELEAKYYTMAISTCAFRPDPDLALQLLDHAEEHAVEPSVHMLTAVVKALGHAGRYEEALAYHERTVQVCAGELSSHVFVAIMHAAGMGGRPDEVLRHLARMREMRVAFTTHAYNCAVAACARAGDVDTAVALANAMEGDGFRPDAFTYAGLVKACVHERRFDAAVQLVRHVLRFRVEPAGAALRPAMEGLDAASRWRDSFSVFKQARAAGVALDHVHWNLAVVAAASAGDLRGAQRTMRDMGREDIFLSARACAAVSNAAARASDPQPARNAIDSVLAFKRADLRPHPACFTALVIAYRRANDLGASVAVLDLMRRHGVVPDAITFHALVQSAVKLRRPEAVRDIVDDATTRMREHLCAANSAAATAAAPPGVRPVDAELTNSAVLGLLFLGDVHGSVDALEKFSAVGFLPSPKTVVQLLSKTHADAARGAERASMFVLRFRANKVLERARAEARARREAGLAAHAHGEPAAPRGDASAPAREPGAAPIVLLRAPARAQAAAVAAKARAKAAAEAAEAEALAEAMAAAPPARGSAARRGASPKSRRRAVLPERGERGSSPAAPNGERVGPERRQTAPARAKQGRGGGGGNAHGVAIAASRDATMQLEREFQLA